MNAQIQFRELRHVSSRQHWEEPSAQRKKASVLGALPALMRAALLALACLMVAGVARAHPDLDAGKRAASELELEQALTSFERAVESGTLTRDELIELLSERAFVFHALHRKAELVNDFIWLSALDPNHRLDLRAPPDLTAIWTSVRDQGRGQLRLELEAIADAESGLHARATPTGTVPEGVRLQIVRKRGTGPFEAKPGGELREPAVEGASFELYARALGLGEVVVAEAFSEESPLRVTTHASDQGALPIAGAPVDEPDNSWRRRNRKWIIGAAVVVAAAGAVVAGVLIAQNKGEDHSDETNLTPMVTF